MLDLDTTLAVLNRPGTWIVMLLDLLLTLGLWRLGETLLELMPARLHTHLLNLLRLVWALGALYALLALLAHLTEFQLEPLYSHGGAIADWFRESAGRIFAVLILAWVAWNLVTVASARIVPASEFSRLSVRVQTLKGVVESALRVAIVVVALVTVLDNIGVRTSTLLAGVSVLGLAVSFGAQSLIKDVITGFFILLEDQFGVGDVITVNGGGLSGTVERMNLRIAALRALDGTLHIVPNGQINTVSVMSKDWSRVVATVGLPPNADVNLALELLSQVAEDLYRDPRWNDRFLQEPKLDGVTLLNKEGFEVRALLKVQPKEQWSVSREFNRRMKLALDRAGLSGMQPQVTVTGQAAENQDGGDQAADDQDTGKAETSTAARPGVPAPTGKS